MKKKVLDNYDACKFLSKYVHVPKSQLVKNYAEIKIKAPLVLKIISEDALHKTEIGGVKIVQEESSMMNSFSDLILIAKKNKINLRGILVQEFFEGEQLIIGIKKDPTFNHVIVFGLGGIFTELLEDISIRKCPITENDAQEMIDELKSKKIFYGFRGKKLNIPHIKKTLVKISEIPIKNKNILEMDINPYILNENNGSAVDARIIFT